MESHFNSVRTNFDISRVMYSNNHITYKIDKVPLKKNIIFYISKLLEVIVF